MMSPKEHGIFERTTPNAERNRMITLFNDDSVRISAINKPESDNITLCFTGIGHAIGGIEVQREEFLKASDNSTTIFVVDKLRSWGNNIDFVSLKHIVESYGLSKKVNAIGNSMGGFSAIIASKFIRIDNVVAFVPQFSVNKTIVPDENRWDKYVDAIQSWNHMSVDGYFVDTTKYYIIAGYGGRDLRHLNLMPSGKNIHKIYFRNSRFFHNAAAALKGDGILYEVMRDCFRGANGSEILKSHLMRSEYNAFVPTGAESDQSASHPAAAT